MSLKEELAQEMEATRRDFHHLLDSFPAAFYQHPSDNPAWTVGDVLYHITLGPPAIRFEIWMIRHARGLFQLAMNETTSNVFNRVNALFAHQPKRITYQTLTQSYEKGHAGLMSSLVRMKEDDFQKSIIYPEAFVAELAGEVTVERLFRYVKGHFDIHAEQIRRAFKESK
jgi:hypothetical protein